MTALGSDLHTWTQSWRLRKEKVRRSTATKTFARLLFVAVIGAIGSTRTAIAQDRCYEHDKVGNLTRIFQANLKTDPVNCGVCGNKCSAQTPLCVNAVCKACDRRIDG